MILLLLLLAAAPPAPQDRVVMVARPKDKPGVFAKLQDSVSRAWHRLYEKGEPNVEQGNALAAEGKPEAALSEYDLAHQKLPDSPELAYDRSTALVKMDPAKAPEAASEALQALQHGDAQLKSKAAYQLGVSQEAMGKPEEAMKSYGAALALDPDDEDSKVNLELLLKTQEERKQKQPQPQQQQKDKKDQQEKKDQQQQSKGSEDKDKKDEQNKQGKDEQKKQEAQQKPEDQAKPEEKKEQHAQAAEKPVDRSEAERLLDALRASEKNLQTWRFAKDKRNNARRSESEKDW